MSKSKNNFFLSPGPNSCAGCGEMVALHAIMRGLNKNTILVNATGCSEVTTTAYPQSAWGLPWIHSLFENASALASGIRAALNYKKNKATKVVVIGGDGATFDIGLGLISGAWERGDNFLYICLDSEAYSNTGFQASGATPYGAATTTGATAGGSLQTKKDMLAIALAHGVKYVAQSTAGFPDDITRKIKKALTISGPSYIQILSPCIPGWKINYDSAIKMGKLAANTGLYPLLEYENNQLISKSKIPSPAPAITDYLKAQGRFSHLFKNPKYQTEIEAISQMAENNILKYNL